MKKMWVAILIIILFSIIVEVLIIKSRLERAEATIESLVDWSNEIDPPHGKIRQPAALHIISY